jgi:hypothetical protein
VEKLRREQERQEKRRSLLILGACIVVVLGLVTAALIPYLRDRDRDSELAGRDLTSIGVPRATAGCLPIKTKTPTGTEASGADGNHVDPGTTIDYPDAPPAFGRHWPDFLQPADQRNFWSRADRPPLEQVVHSLEHGHTFLWYDDTIKEDSAEYQTLKDLADKFTDDLYFNVLPWKSTDGGAFPDGTHVVLTHWTGGDKQTGVWEYCAKTSGEVVGDFVEKYPSSNAPEAGAP